MYSNRLDTHINCTARLFPQITEQKNKLRRKEKAAKHSKEDTSKIKRRLSDIKLFHFTRPPCNLKPRSL